LVSAGLAAVNRVVSEVGKVPDLPILQTAIYFVNSVDGVLDEERQSKARAILSGFNSDE
jgi:hypothetical protein